MKKILLSICNYGTSNKPYLIRMLEQIKTFQKYDVDVLLFSNIPNPDIVEKYGVEEVVYPTQPPHLKESDIGYYLHHMHKAYFVYYKDDYDVFVHTDNDHLFLESHFDAFLRDTEIIDDYTIIPGFIQYENKDNIRYYIGLWGDHLEPNAKIYKIKDEEYVIPGNLHTAFYMVTKEHFKIALDSKEYLKFRGGNIKVSAVTDIYRYCGLQKIVLINKYEDYLIHHMPDKYVTPNHAMGRPLLYSETDFNNDVAQLR